MNTQAAGPEASADPPCIKYFFDTEFVEYQDRVIPVSIGVVSETGREYYAEYDTDWLAHASDWVKRHVAPHLEGSVKPLLQIREELTAFVGSMPSEFWAYFASTDWVVMCQTMGTLTQLPPNWKPWVLDLVWLDESRKRIQAVPFHNVKPHHALWDARELKARYEGLKAGKR